MKKVVSLMLCLLIVFGCATTAMAESNTETMTLKELTDCYYQCLKAQNPSAKQSDAKAYIANTMGSGLLSRLFKKSSGETYSRTKKIIDFYYSASKDDFTHLYHPYADEATKNAEMLSGLPTDNSLCIMLFGNRLNSDGSMSDKFKARCETALDVAEKYPNALIMVTGGHTAGDEYPSEAEVGRDWLIEHGINENRIVIDPNSWDSFANVMCSLTFSELREHKEVKKIVVVSSDYHVEKCSIFLMTYIYAFGMDLPEWLGGRGYSYGGNLGAVLG